MGWAFNQFTKRGEGLFSGEDQHVGKKRKKRKEKKRKEKKRKEKKRKKKLEPNLGTTEAKLRHEQKHTIFPGKGWKGSQGLNCHSP